MSSKTDHKAVAVLLRGQECANTLKLLFENRENSSVAMESLINTILDSFSLALSFIDTPNPPPHHESSSQNMPGLVPRRSLTKKISGVKCAEHYRDDSPNPLLEDGFSWRKYGQKTIKNTPYQRNYYRCTYAQDRNCNATKRVQQVQDSPPVHRTTYVGQHMCNAMAFEVFSNIDDAKGSKMIKFGTHDHVMPESVMPQLASLNHPEVTMEDEAKNHVMTELVMPQLPSLDHPEVTMEDEAKHLVMPELVMPQLASLDHPEVTMEDEAKNHVMPELFMPQLASLDHPEVTMEDEAKNHVMPELVMRQFASLDHPEVTMEDEAKNHVINQEFTPNFVDDDELWAYQFPPFSPTDFMFLENLLASD